MTQFLVCLKSFWDSFQGQSNKDELLKVFIEPKEVNPKHVDLIEKFVLSVYYPKKKIATSLDAKKIAHFKRLPSNNLRKLPLSRAGLVEHIKRAAVQSGWLWKECSEDVTLPDFSE